MINLTIKITENTFSDGINRLVTNFSNLKPFLTKIGNAVVSYTETRFASEQSPKGIKWRALRPVTIKLRHNPNNPILTDLGKLRNSFIANPPSENSVTIGTPVIYARTHQFGADKGEYGTYTTSKGATFPIPWGDVPERPILPADEFPIELGDKIKNIFREHYATTL